MYFSPEVSQELLWETPHFINATPPGINYQATLGGGVVQAGGGVMPAGGGVVPAGGEVVQAGGGVVPAGGGVVPHACRVLLGNPVRWLFGDQYLCCCFLQQQANQSRSTLIRIETTSATHIIHINHTELLFMSPHNYSHNSHKPYRALIYVPSQLLT